MHKLGCPQRNNPYGPCECKHMDIMEHTEQLRRHNELLQEARTNAFIEKRNCPYSTECEGTAKRRDELEAEKLEWAEAFEQLAHNFPAIQVDCDSPIIAAKYINVRWESLSLDLTSATSRNSLLEAQQNEINAKWFNENQQLRADLSALEKLAEGMALTLAYLQTTAHTHDDVITLCESSLTAFRNWQEGRKVAK